VDVADLTEGRVVAYDLDAFAALNPDARRPFFEEAAAHRGLVMPIIEKDFWVVWSLHVLFDLPDRDAFVFKGGTSLSKAFGLIERFSEDIDLVLDRARFGFAGAADVTQATSGEQRRRRREQLDAMVATYLREDLVPRLTRIARATSGVVVEIDGNDPLSILVRYPAAEPDHPYVRPVVKIETGGRADSWPTVDRPIHAYVALEFPQAFENDEVTVKTIEARRTFLEKLTILHKTAHAFDAEQPVAIAERFSRHYYDVYRMSLQETEDVALLDGDLLVAVRTAAQAFFPQTKAKYEEFQVGSIRIVPPPRGVEALARDYIAMKDMFFGEAPPFEAILEVLAELERRVNAVAQQ